MDILLIHAEKRVRDLLSFAIEEKFKTKVAAVPDLALAEAALPQKPKLIVYSFREEKDDNFKKFMKAKKGICSILITNDVPTEIDNSLDGDLGGCISQIDLLDNLCIAIENLIQKNKLEFTIIEELPESEFCRIQTNLLVDASPFKAAVFIKLSNTRFLKIFSEGDNFEAADLEKYFLKKQIAYFWLRKKDTGLFLDNYRKILDKHLSAEKIDIQTAKEITIAATETMHELSNKMGFTPEVGELARTNMMIAVKAMQSAPGLRELLKRFELEKDKYIPAHSTITAFVACAISKIMSWGSEATLQNNSLAMIRNLKELEAAKPLFSEEEIKSYEQHPMAAAELIRAVPGAPADVDTIIMQHHETGDGKGFPRKLSATHISPLSSIFIVAHEIVQGSIEGKKDVADIIEELKIKYTTGNFRKILKELNADNIKA
jgi:HD-GYP domain-containing protein (c-di-GMP phosphodiesterase class II)